MAVLEPLKVTIQNFDKVPQHVIHLGYFKFHEIRAEKFSGKLKFGEYIKKRQQQQSDLTCK